MPDAEAGETLTVSVGGVLDAAVGVEDEAGQRLAAPDGHAAGGESEICVDAVGEGVADDLDVYKRQIEKLDDLSPFW